MPVLISDIYEPLTFATLIDEKAIELNAFYSSGVVAEDPSLSAQAAAGGRIGELTNFGPLANTDPNISSDDPASFSTPEKIASKKQIWRLAALNQSWSSMDLARELALKDPAMAITDKIGQYWATAQERRVIQSGMGILNNNATDDSDDMIVDISNDLADPITADELISPDVVIAAQQTAGDHQFVFKVIAMHSVVFSNLKMQNVIDFIPASNSVVMIPTYLGLRVVVDDSLPAVAGTNRIIYTTFLYGAGAIAHGKGNVVNPSEYERIPSAGDGGGQEIIYSRTSDIYHPWGMSFLSDSVAAESATLAELATASNWDRVYDRKNVEIAFIKSNG